MKKIFLTLSLLAVFTMNAQVLGYSDFGVLLTNENNQGTARSMALKGAFGSLGGDLNAISINPAGAAVFNNSSASFTLAYDRLDLQTDFYGNRNDNTTDSFNLSQAGGILLFDDDDFTEGINRISLSLNYEIVNNFKNNWIASGISEPTWTEDPSDNTIHYTNLEDQTYKNFTSGKNAKLNFALAARFNENLFLGVALNSYNVEFNEESSRHELANDGNSNSVDALEKFWQKVTADGFSLGVGFIYRMTQNFRLGLSYYSPVWYEVYEESNIFAEDDSDYVGYYNVLYSNDPPAYENNKDKILTYEYNLRTPSKTTASISYVFGKSGLISADFSRKNYKGIHLNPKPDFTDENSNINSFLQNTYKVQLGTEWRIKSFSVRGGYSYEKTPFINSIASDNPTGYALGAGYNFGDFIIDLVYDHTEQTDLYDFYPEFNTINAANLTKNNDKIMATLTIKL